jgi:hypothetical protein
MKSERGPAKIARLRAPKDTQIPTAPRCAMEAMRVDIQIRELENVPRRSGDELARYEPRPHVRVGENGVLTSMEGEEKKKKNV